MASDVIEPKRQRLVPWPWPKGGMQVLMGNEAGELASRIRSRAIAALSAEPDAEQRSEAFLAWLEYRFLQPLERDAVAGPAFGKASTAIGVSTIAAGLASSAVSTATDGGAVIVVGVLGIVVGILGAINQIWQPSQRSIARYQAAFALRREGWDYVQARERYEGVDSIAALGVFVDEVRRIHRTVESIDEASSAASG